MAIKASHVWGCAFPTRSLTPWGLLKRLLIYNTKHTSSSAKQCKITWCACVRIDADLCVCVFVHLSVVHSKAALGTALNKTLKMH